MKGKVVIVDYRAGNLKSVQNMLKKLGYDSEISSDYRTIGSADKLILPGVGSFDHGTRNLKSLGLWNCLNDKVIGHKTPILGICLGVQLFTRCSEEGSTEGLNWISAETIKFKPEDCEEAVRIPHMGWNDIFWSKNSPISQSLNIDPRFYFVHSYHLSCDSPSDLLATCRYGYLFCCAVEKENVIGVQFHPEKSHRFGLSLLKNFVENY